jgi:hypothetical protein
VIRWATIRALQRRATGYTVPWTTDGQNVLEGWQLIGTFRDPATAQFVVDMQQWYATLVNAVILLRRKVNDEHEIAISDQVIREAKVRSHSDTTNTSRTANADESEDDDKEWR